MPQNPFYSEYLIEASENFTTLYSPKEGNITFYHLASNQSFFLEYFLFESGYPGTEYDRRIWILPPGLYTITWNNDDSTPHYKLIGLSFFYPMDEMYVLVSGIVVVIVLIVLISPIIKISKEFSLT